MSEMNTTGQPRARLAASHWLPVYCGLVFALLSAPLASAATLAKLELTGFVAPCSPQNTRSCVKADASSTWPVGQSFPVVYDLSQTIGDIVPFTMPTLFFPDVVALGTDAFKLSFVKGTFDTNAASREVQITMNLVIERNGTDSAPSSFTMTTGTSTVPLTSPCGIPINISLTGTPHVEATNEVSIIGNACVNFAADGGFPDWNLLQVSLTGTMGSPSDAAAQVPTLTEWGVMGLALLLAAAGVWWLRASPSQQPAAH